mmetsp:Transcript_76931/g.220939  ORF Transcript_76931/g.220939 Transcript_76931/m.220939 type:complete len:208 (-) Transcript_76931:1150-1773(-)
MKPSTSSAVSILFWPLLFAFLPETERTSADIDRSTFTGGDGSSPSRAPTASSCDTSFERMAVRRLMPEPSPPSPLMRGSSLVSAVSVELMRSIVGCSMPPNDEDFERDCRRGLSSWIRTHLRRRVQHVDVALPRLECLSRLSERFHISCAYDQPSTSAAVYLRSSSQSPWKPQPGRGTISSTLLTLYDLFPVSSEKCARSVGSRWPG